MQITRSDLMLARDAAARAFNAKQAALANLDRNHTEANCAVAGNMARAWKKAVARHDSMQRQFSAQQVREAA